MVTVAALLADYLQELQQWDQGNIPNLQAGDVILMREDGMHSLQWRLNIIEVHPGLDRRVHVVTHYTTRGTYNLWSKRVLLPLTE